MDKYQVRACVDAGTGLVYTNTEGTPQGIFAINTTGANDGDVLTYFSASGTVGWTPGGGGGGGNYWNLLGNAGTNPATNFLGTTDAQDLVIKTDSVERIRVLATGNVGIGTATPAYKLDVLGDIHAEITNGLGTIGSLNFDINGLLIDINDTTKRSSFNYTLSVIKVEHDDTTNNILKQLTIDDNYTSFNVINTGTTYRTIIDNSGNWGIGTLSPTAKLHVVGTVQIEDGTQAAGYVLTSDANGVASWQPASGGVTPSALTKTDDTNVTLTLGGTPATALLQSVSLTLGWTGQLSVARGGTGLGTLGTANQLLRVNAGATALEYFTPTYISGLTVGTTTIASGTAGRVLFEGVGNVLQENSNLNFDTTNGLIIGGSTARGTRLTVVNSANTQATKIFVQRNAADSADYTTLRGDGSVDFANIGSTANVLVYANGSTLIQTYGSAGLRNSLFGLANATSITGGTVAYNTFVGAESTLSSSTGTTAYNTAVGFTTNITNANNCTIVGTFTRMNGANRAIVIGGRSTAGPVRDVTGTDVILFGYGTDANALNYTNSAVFYFNNANASTWFHSNGNLGLFGKKYQILNDSTGTAANRLNTYMDINATNTLTIHNGTAPAVNIADGVQLYGADVVAGNTALFVRTENGAILKLYQETTAVGSATVVSPGAGSNIKTDDTFDGYTIQQVVKALRNQGILA